MALVLDASVLAPYLVADGLGVRVAERLADDAGALHVPHLAIVEVVSCLRGLVRGGHLRGERAAMAGEDLAAFPAVRWPAEPLLPRIWGLRNNLTAYDATYVALTEALDAVLLTHDARLAAATAQLGTAAVEII
jgi:predicted nucleic acid-binding protein